MKKLLPAPSLAESIKMRRDYKNSQEMSGIIDAITKAADDLEFSVEVPFVSKSVRAVLIDKEYLLEDVQVGMNEYAVKISWE